MVRPIVHDPIFLSRRSVPAVSEDVPVADDLMDTLIANADGCVGMAANMIGVAKAIIVFADGDKYSEMFNPRILSAKDPYDAQEGCLSLAGTRQTKRYRSIKVQWQDRLFRTRVKNFTGWTAQIIQHEIDHINGILI